MDAITHALYKALSNPETSFGLKDIGSVREVWDAYADAQPSDQYASIHGGHPEALALQLEFVAAGFSPPAGMANEGADVIISKGRIDVMVPTDDGSGTWTAILAARPAQSGYASKASWQEQEG